MSFTTDWGVTLPLDHTKFKDMPSAVRNLRTDLEERLADIIYGFTAGETDAYKGLKKGRLITIGTAAGTTPPGTDAAASIDIYARANGTASAVELWALDASGNETQITDAGKICVGSFFKTGDWIISTVTTARTGWTNVSATYSNKFMRINATPLTTGGADTDSITLTTTELPAHTHTVSTYQESRDSSATPTVNSGINNPSAGMGSANIATSSSGSGSAFTVDTVPAYVQVVVFQKD